MQGDLTAAEKDVIHELFLAVQKYVEMRGGTVLVAGGPDVYHDPADRKNKFTVVVKCTGLLPDKDSV